MMAGGTEAHPGTSLAPALTHDMMEVDSVDTKDSTIEDSLTYQPQVNIRRMMTCCDRDDDDHPGH